MSKYDKLGLRRRPEGDELMLTFDEDGAIAGVPLDHSFLNYKKELVPHGWEVGKISMKQQTSSDWRNRPRSTEKGRRLAKRTFAGNRPKVLCLAEDSHECQVAVCGGKPKRSENSENEVKDCEMKLACEARWGYMQPILPDWMWPPNFGRSLIADIRGWPFGLP